MKIEDIQNISLFVIASCSFLSYLYYNLAPFWYGQNDTLVEFAQPFYQLLPFVGLHAATDLFLTKSYDIKLHHFFVIGNIFYNYYCDVSPEHGFTIAYTLLKTEISSIFYVFKYWLPKKTIIYNINTILFYFSFAKLRIYDFYYEILYNNISCNTLFQKYSQSNYYVSSILFISVYGLYILNLYWFLIMNKILFKQIAKHININTDILCHFLCSYLHWINIPVSCYIYSYNPREKNIFDIVGITILSIASYKYHNDIYVRLYDKQIEEYTIPNNDNMVLFINDCISINARSFLVVVTSYYNSQHLFLVLTISGICHVSSIYHCIVNVLELHIDYDKYKNTFLTCHNILSAIPIACDVILIYIHSPIDIAVPFLLLNIIIGLLFVVDPFYKLTHVAFHILLIVQNYYMCLSNNR